MDVVGELLRPKFSEDWNPSPQQWDQCQRDLIHAFLRKRGIHQDELENYNSYIDEIVALLKEHVKINYVDQFDQLHNIEILEAHYVLPYEERVGIDSPERALLRNHYECEVHGLVRYRIMVKPEEEEEEGEGEELDFGENVELSPSPQSPVWSDEEEDISSLEKPLKKAKMSKRKQEPTSDTVTIDVPTVNEEEDEEEEDEEEEEEEEEEDDLDEEDDDEADNDHEDEDEEDMEELFDKMKLPEDTDEDEEQDEEAGQAKKNKARKSAKKTRPKSVENDGEEELRPSVGRSRHTERSKPAFFIQKENFSAYSVVIHEAKDHHHIMNLPPWIRSKLCWMSTPFRDPSLMNKPYLMGCNYMVNRNFKLCPYEEYYANNRVLAHREEFVEIRSKFYQLSRRFRTNCTLKFFSETRKFRKNQNWYQPPRFLLEIPHETPRTTCPVTVMAMAYGWKQRDFVDCVRMFLRYELTPEIEMFLQIIGVDVCGCNNQRDALKYVSTCLTKCKSMNNPDDIASYVSFTLREEFMPNLINNRPPEPGTVVSHAWENLRKGYMLAEAVAELIQLSPLVNEKRAAEDQWKTQDMRSYATKRIDTPGEKISFLARKYIKHFAKKGLSNLKKAVDNRRGIDLNSILSRKTIKITNSVKNGIWDSKSDASDSNQNKTQMMITGYCSDAMQMQVQKIVKFAMKKNSNPEPLLTHPTQTGRVDLYITPESERCGIMRNKALGCWITPLIDIVKMDKLIRKLLNKHAVALGWVALPNPDQPDSMQAPLFYDQSYTIVKDVYGGVIGWVKNAFAMYQLFVKYRRKGALWFLLGMEWDRKRDIFYFNCDEGRMCRPLIILENLPELMRVTQTMSFQCHPDPVKLLMEKGLVEYMDAAEEFCGLVFTSDSLEASQRAGYIHTHMEIHGIFSLSITVAKAFCNFNQGPRRMYTGNMEKRSLGLKLFDDRGTTVSYSLWYGQDPIMSEPVDEALGLRHKEPNGFNIVLAVLSDKVNIEDSYVMKKEALERGMCVSSETMVTVAALGSGCSFQKPDSRTRGKAPGDKYEHILEDGTPEIGAHLKGGDAVIGKVFQKKEGSETKKRCVSRFLPWNMDYTVKSVARYPNSETKTPKIVRVSLSKTNWPQVGNKYYMAHGQKGTTSEIRPSIDMPFFCHGPMAGQTPDMLTNVHSLSRITLGLSLEMLWGKARALNPAVISQYQTVFLSKITFREKMKLCAAVLKENGLRYTGKETMRMGTTGKEIRCGVYSGMVYLRVLKHMAQDKLRSRERGPINEMTRQTSVGKKHYGGQKQGENENWNINCYGMAGMFRNINHESADKFMLYFCTNCHTQCMGCKEAGFYFCKVCNSSENVVRIPNTYITNLTFQELYTAGFGHTIVSKPMEKDSLELDEDMIFDQCRRMSVDQGL